MAKMINQVLCANPSAPILLLSLLYEQQPFIPEIWMQSSSCSSPVYLAGIIPVIIVRHIL